MPKIEVIRTRYTVLNAHQWVKDVEASLQGAARKGLYSAGLKLVQVIKTKTIPQTTPHPPFDNGAYSASWKVKKIPDGVLVYSTMPYASVIEYGGRPGFKIGSKMINLLTLWVQRKGIGSYSDIKTRKVKKINVLDATKVAWAIAKTMQKKGMYGGRNKGLRVLGRAMQEAPRIIQEEIAAEIAAAKAKAGGG